MKKKYFLGILVGTMKMKDKILDFVKEIKKRPSEVAINHIILEGN